MRGAGLGSWSRAAFNFCRENSVEGDLPFWPDAPRNNPILLCRESSHGMVTHFGLIIIPQSKPHGSSRQPSL